MAEIKDMDAPLPPAAPFIPVATMFKLSGPDSLTVECVSCGQMFPLADLLTCELEEDECPTCLVSSNVFWAGKTHRPPV